MTRRSEDGTIAIGLGDWVPVGKEKSSDYDVPLAFSDSVMVMDMAKKATEMFRIIGATHEASYASAVYEDMRSAIRTHLVDTAKGLVSGTCQCGQAIGLYYGVFEPDEEANAFQLLLDLIHQKEERFDCGFLGMHCIFHVLTRFGESELAYRMITQKGYPSYGHWIDLGYTAIPEKFMPDETKAISYNHHFLGDVARWLMEAVAGLYIIDDRTVEIHPHPTGDLTFAEAWHDLPQGKVSVRWERIDGKIKLNYTCPDGVICRVRT
jgi:alpha-L-rhamnosidase